MVPHERSLVTRLQNKPFALLGVDCDKDKSCLKETQDKKQITWRSWWDGLDGPIRKAYKIQAFPTIYVIDRRGVIRFKNIEGKKLDLAVERLLAESAENSSARP
jgi:hypothetical protein